MIRSLDQPRPLSALATVPGQRSGRGRQTGTTLIHVDAGRWTPAESACRMPPRPYRTSSRRSRQSLVSSWLATCSALSLMLAAKLAAAGGPPAQKHLKLVLAMGDQLVAGRCRFRAAIGPRSTPNVRNPAPCLSRLRWPGPDCAPRSPCACAASGTHEAKGGVRISEVHSTRFRVRPDAAAQHATPFRLGPSVVPN
jgi:hypothetical protein